MRITNKIMQNNAMSNINANKILEDKLSTQMSSGKKINRPSEDPVIAIRALRLRTTLTEVTQYHDKNVEDADSWLTLTEDAIKTVSDIITDMQEECTDGARDNLTSANRKIILENLKALRDEVYATGDADYAGRGLFTGYRTSMKLRFQEETEKSYLITEKLDKSALDDIMYIKMDNQKNSIGEINSGNYTNEDYKMEETDVSRETVHRIRLSYDALDPGVTPIVGYYTGDARLGTSYQTLDIDTISLYETTTITDANGNQVEVLVDPYQAVSAAGHSGDAYAVFIPETGELLLNEKAYSELSAARDYAATGDIDEGAIMVQYQKTSWKEGDLRPEHYFTCVEDPNGQPIIHNQDNGDANDQIISYDVGFNQEIRVNTLASECYTHAIGRDIDDLISVLEQVEDVEGAVTALEKIVEDESVSEDDRKIAEQSLAAANKALTFLNEKLQTSFESAITKMQGHLDKTTLALTDVGTRTKKLDLVESRLASQKTNFKDLVADNEQADTAEVATDLASAKLAYDAALQATGQILNNSLLNYI